MKKKGSILSVSMLIVLFLASISISDYWAIQPVTDNDLNDRFPNVSDGYIVWQGFDGNDWEIYIKSASGIEQITDNDVDDRYPVVSDNGYVVWEHYDGSDYEIFLYHHAGPSYYQITDNNYDDRSPNISDNGNFVVFTTVGKLYLYNFSTTTLITDDEGAGVFAMNPVVNNAGQIAWFADDSEYDYEIYLYDSSTILQITDNDFDDWHPAISNAGEVVWYGYGELDASDITADAEIFYFAGGSIYQVTGNDDSVDSAVDDTMPDIGDNGKIVWCTSNSEIFVHTYGSEGSTYQLTHAADYIAASPSIAGINSVVWSGIDTTPDDLLFDEEIFTDNWIETYIGDSDDGGSGSSGGGGCFITTAFN